MKTRGGHITEKVAAELERERTKLQYYKKIAQETGWKSLREIRKLSRIIIELREAENALAQSEEWYRTLVENTLDGYFILEAESGRFLFLNQRICELFGYSRDEAQGLSVWEVIAPGCHHILRSRLECWLGGKEPNPERAVYEARRRDGSSFRAEISASRVTFQGKTVIQGVLRDITEREVLHRQLLQAQKMEAVGTLAAGVAHDFNNLLQTVQGYAELLRLRQGEGEDAGEQVQHIINAARRGSELTRQLLTFSRKIDSEKRPVDLNQKLTEVRNFLERTIPKMIEIELNLAEDLKLVNADPSQIEQVLMNLAVNARDAMPEGGKLVIETRNVSLDEAYCKIHLGPEPGEYVLLGVSDTGEGMHKEPLERIFEPFYTTKACGKGTGLGLAMVYGIVKAHSGHIVCHSEPGKGTDFNIYLPVLEREAGSVEAQEAEVALKGGSETILLVEDEETIMKLGEQILSEFGYPVLATSDGESGIELYRKHQKQVDLVILDLIMPGIGGKKCMEELLRLDPNARILIASGHFPSGPARKILDAGAAGYVNKPYEIRQMLQEIRRVLDQDNPRRR